jgi:hypothetical protein
MTLTPVRIGRLVGGLLLVLVVLAVPGRSLAQGIAVSITIAPPVLPIYTQPICPGEGYLWTPGTGLGTMATITGFPAPGFSPPSPVSSGLRDIGAGATAPISGTKAIGEQISASMVASTTDSDTSAPASRADIGKAETSSTTLRS